MWLMKDKWSVGDYLYYGFFLFCILLIAIAFIIEDSASTIALGMVVSGVFGFIIFAYTHKFFERKYLSYIITFASMIFTGIAFSLENYTLMRISLIGTLVLCAIIWILCRIRYGKSKEWE